VAAVDAGPRVWTSRVSATIGTVVLRAAEVRLTVRVGQAVIELRHCVVVIQRTPDNRRRNRKESARREFVTADRTRGRDRAATWRYATRVTNVTSLGVVGLVHTAVVGGD